MMLDLVNHTKNNINSYLIEKIMKLVIDRQIWLRGKGVRSDESGLLIDGEKCCLGFLATACGATDQEINNKFSPQNVPHLKWVPGILNGNITSVLCNKLMRVNDSELNCNDEVSYYRFNILGHEDIKFIGEQGREELLAKLFASIDVEVSFIN